jgi:hypothetical protein
MNRTDVPLYSVWVAVRPDKSIVTAESITIDVGDASTALWGRAGPVEFAGDVVIYNSFEKERQRESVLLLIHTLPPGATRELILSGTIAVATEAEVSPLSFGREPAAIREKLGAAALPLTPPFRGFTIMAVRALVRRAP